MKGTITISLEDYEELKATKSDIEAPLFDRINQLNKNIDNLMEKDFDFFTVNRPWYSHKIYYEKNKIPKWIIALFA